MPLEGADAGAERPGHRVKLVAVGNVNHAGGSVGEILRLVGLEHLIERRIEEQLDDVGPRLPAVRGPVFAGYDYPGRTGGVLRSLPLARLDQPVFVLPDFLDAGRNAQQLIALVGVFFVGSSGAFGLFHRNPDADELGTAGGDHRGSGGYHANSARHASRACGRERDYDCHGRDPARDEIAHFVTFHCSLFTFSLFHWLTACARSPSRR